MLTRIILKSNVLRKKYNGMFNITSIYSLRQFSNNNEQNSSTSKGKGMSFLKMDINSMKSRVIYGIGGVSLFYLFTKGFYVITYDLLASSPAGLISISITIINFNIITLKR